MRELIFIVESEPTIIELYQSIFLDEGYSVKTLGRRVLPSDLTLVKTLRPQLLIIDQLIEAGRPGWQFIQLLQKDPATANIPIIICTADSRFIKEFENWQARNRADNLQLVLKPFELGELLETVNFALKHYTILSLSA